MNTLCLVLSHNYVITINQYLNQCLHLSLFACILSDEKARKTFYKKVAMCSDGGEWRDNFHFSSNNYYHNVLKNVDLIIVSECTYSSQRSTLGTAAIITSTTSRKLLLTVQP